MSDLTATVTMIYACAVELLDGPVCALRTVVAHLGSGASLCAVDGGGRSPRRWASP